MSTKPRPENPDGWRALLNDALSEPELPDDARNGSRRQRRRARKAARTEQRQRTREAIDAERRREPTTVGGAALLIAAILLVGWVGARWLGDDDNGGSGDSASPAASASPSPTQEPSQEDAGPGTSPSPSASTSATTGLSDPEQVAENWARAYLSRNPPEDGDHVAAVDRASPWMSNALAQNLAEHDDPLFNELVSRGGISQVTEVAIAEADPELGTDTPLRIWRELTVTAEVDGYEDYTDTYTIQVEVSQQTDGEWLVTRVLGL